MSDSIQHECGIAAIRLKKPLSWYHQRHGSWWYGLQKLFLVMEKQHNRGQDGTGIGCCKLSPEAGQPYLFRERSTKRNAMSKVFGSQMKAYSRWAERSRKEAKKAGAEFQVTEAALKRECDFAAEILIGHLRYGTSGLFQKQACHPYLRQSNWPTRSLMVAGNFTMANAAELNQLLIQRGQHPVFDSDTQTVLEDLGFHLDQNHAECYRRLRDEGIEPEEIPGRIADELDIAQILRETCPGWDGGYAIAGVVGSGDFFMVRDPHGIRPCHYFENDELVAFASERAPLLTAFACEVDEVQELPPAHAFVIKADGSQSLEAVTEVQRPAQCTFERIYFSRGNDPAIYQERKALGAALVPPILQAVDQDLEKTVISFIPNTAETAYFGLMEGLRMQRRREVRDSLLEAARRGEVTSDLIDELIMRNWPRGEKVAHKDAKLRTFITQEGDRNQLVSHVYDITYGVVQSDDALVVLDDSIVRGTTLRTSILKILARTNPRKIVIASTAPQIRYPDCYGIDMAEVGKFIAFQAAVNLLDRRGLGRLKTEVFDQARAELEKPAAEQINAVKRIYEPFAAEEISAEISRMVYPEDSDWRGEVEVIFQSIESLHRCLPQHTGVWYFTGDYPTPAGTQVANTAYCRWFRGLSGRGYELL